VGLSNIYTQQWFVGLRRLFLYQEWQVDRILESQMTNFLLKENKNRTKKEKKKKRKKKEAKTRKI
jgi:hypothetical protein